MIDLTTLFSMMVETAGEAAAEGGGDNFLMLTWLMPTVTVVVLILWKILDVTFFTPLRRVLDERERLTYGRLAEARALLEKIQQEQERYEKAIAEARQEANQLMAEARERADRSRSEMIDRAREEVRTYLEQAKKEIEQNKLEAMNQIVKDIDAMVTEIFKRVIGRVPENITPETITRVRQEVEQELRSQRLAS